MITIRKLDAENFWVAESGSFHSYAATALAALADLTLFMQEEQRKVAEREAKERERTARRIELAARVEKWAAVGRTLSEVEASVRDLGLRNLNAITTHLATVQRLAEIELSKERNAFHNA